MQYASGQNEDTYAPIDIPPHDVEMTESLATVHYLSSSMSSTVEDPHEHSPSLLPDLPSVITLGSKLVDSSSNCYFITPCDHAHVNVSSHYDDSGSFISPRGISSTSHPIFYSNYEIMEAFTTPEFFYPPLP